MNAYSKTEILYSIINDKHAELDVLRTMIDAGVISDRSKLEQIEAQLQLLKKLDLNATVEA